MVGARFKFRMELTGHEVAVLLQFDDFHEIQVFVDAGDGEAGVSKHASEFVVEFVAVAVAF